MQIVIVCDFGEVNGGAAKVAITSARGLADAGVPVTYICAIGPVSPILDHRLITVHCLELSNVWERGNPLAAAAQAIWNQSARTALSRLLAGMPSNGALVHFHQWTKAFSPSILDGAARRGLPSVVSLHDYFIACPNGAYYQYGKAEICRLKPMSMGCVASNCDRSSYTHKLIRVFRQLSTRYALARAGASLSFISVSPLAERVIDRYLPRAHARFVVRSPIEAPTGEAALIDADSEFLFVGRLTEEKGVRLLADVARAAGLPLTIVGDGPLLAELSQLGGRVRCLGWLDGGAVDQAMKRARALIFPSTWHETGGLVVIEALARGVPVIVSRVTAAADFIEEGVNGFIVDPDDRVALLNRMQTLMGDGVAARMGAAAVDGYRRNPQSAENHTHNLLSTYRTVMSAYARLSPSTGEFA